MSEYGIGRWKDIRDDDRQGTGAKGLAYSGSTPVEGHVLIVHSDGSATDGGTVGSGVGILTDARGRAIYTASTRSFIRI